MFTQNMSSYEKGHFIKIPQFNFYKSQVNEESILKSKIGGMD